MYAHHAVYNVDNRMSGLMDIADMHPCDSLALLNSLRPVPLSAKETVIDSLVTELRRVPEFNTAIKAVEIIGSGYVATDRDRERSLSYICIVKL